MAEPDAALAVDHVEVVYVHFGGVAALSDAVSLRAAAGRRHRAYRPERRRQDDPLQRHHGAATAESWHRSLAGTDVTRKGTHRRARLGLARTFQRLELFSTLSAVDNVRGARSPAPARERRTPAEAVYQLARVGLQEADCSVRSLPTGSARLVELARALAPDPRCSCSTSRVPVSTARDRRPGDELRVAGGRGPRRRPRRARHRPGAADLRTVHVLDFGQVIASGPPEVRPTRPCRRPISADAIGPDAEPDRRRTGRHVSTALGTAERRDHRRRPRARRPTGASRCCTGPAGSRRQRVRCSVPTVPERARCSSDHGPAAPDGGDRCDRLGDPPLGARDLGPGRRHRHPRRPRRVPQPHGPDNLRMWTYRGGLTAEVEERAYERFPR